MQETLRVDVESLLDLLARSQIDYTLVGGMAVLFYAEGRNVPDLDLLVAPAEASALPWDVTLLDRNFARAWLYETDIGMLLDVSDVLDSDLLPTLAQHVAPGDLAELSQILQDQRQRRRFQP